jgi:hypothetical protein
LSFDPDWDRLEDGLSWDGGGKNATSTASSASSR